MSNFAFSRIYHLQVIDKGETISTQITVAPEEFISGAVGDAITAQVPTPLTPSTPRSTKTSTSLSLAEVTFNRLEAKIKFSGVSSVASSDTHVIKLYNLDRETISFIRRSGAKIILRAGYKGQYPNTPPNRLPEVFKGEVATSRVVRDGSNTVTELTLSSAITERKRATVSEYFLPSESLVNVLSKIAKKLDLPYTINIGDKSSLTLGKQKSWSGCVLDVLDRIALEYGLRVYIINEVLIIEEFASPILDEAKKITVIEINKERIKGSISLSTDHTKTEIGDETEEVDFTMFLEPRVVVGTVIRLEVEGKTSDFKVESVMHRLDTHGAAWDTVVSGKGVRTKKIT